MRKVATVGMLILFSLLLLGCSSKRYPSTNMTMSKETWMYQVNTHPELWTRGADSWFLAGKPNPTELRNRNAPYSAAMSTMRVRVPNFTEIRVNGDFQVQIFGTDGPNSVFVSGPNSAIRGVSIEVQGNILCINQLKKFPMRLSGVIIRIGMKDLRRIMHMGCGSIEGVGIHSSCLYITATPASSGAIFLSGNMNVREIKQFGRGCITIFGAVTPVLDIIKRGPGLVNVSGNVGIHRILQTGVGDINIIGANSDDLKIYADGAGTIAISGPVNLTQVQAKKRMKVYVRNVRSTGTYAYALDRAVIGLAGTTPNLYADTACNAMFLGRYLCATSAYARARDNSHINVTAAHKIFASAQQNARIFFFGSPKLLSQFVSGNGTVIPIWGGTAYCGIEERRPISYKGELRGYTPRSVQRQYVGAG